MRSLRTFALGLLVENGMGASRAWQISERWGGGRLVVFSSAQGEIAVAWRVTWPDPGDLQLVTETLGNGGSLRIETLGSDLLITAAQDPAVLDAWGAASECGTSDDLPEQDADSSMMMALRY